MTYKQARITREETERFLAKLKALMEDAERFPTKRDEDQDLTGMLAASAKRASLDLTRTLADFRRSWPW